MDPMGSGRKASPEMQRNCNTLAWGERLAGEPAVSQRQPFVTDGHCPIVFATNLRRDELINKAGAENVQRLVGYVGNVHGDS